MYTWVQVSEEAREGIRSSETVDKGSCESPNVCVLGTELRSSERAVYNLNHGTLSQTLTLNFCPLHSLVDYGYHRHLLPWQVYTVLEIKPWVSDMLGYCSPNWLKAPVPLDSLSKRNSSTQSYLLSFLILGCTPISEMLKQDAQRWWRTGLRASSEGVTVVLLGEGVPKSLWKVFLFPERQCDTGTLSVPFCFCLCLLLATDSRQVTPSLWPPFSHLSAGMRTVIPPYSRCKDELGEM